MARRMYFDIKWEDKKRRIYGTLIKSRGLWLIKGDDGKTYDPIGWREVPDA